MKLSEHFTLEEMIKSDYALRRGLPNNPSPEIIKRMIPLCAYVLEPIRALFNVPLIVTSGYRSPVVNSGIGGASTSQHTKGEACDFHVLDVSNFVVVKEIANSGIPFDQLIYEFGEDGWVHVSHAYLTPQRRQVLSAQGGSLGTVYSPLDLTTN